MSSRPDATGSVAGFLAGTYLLAWACFLPLVSAISVRTALGQGLLLLGTFAPSLVALGLTRRSEGAGGVRELLGRILPGHVGWGWYAFAAGYMAAIKLTVALFHVAISGVWPRFGDTPWIVIPFAIALSTPVQAGEEIGWRGYLLPRLAARLGLARASLLLGGIWAFWHLPLFFVREADKYGQSFPVYLLQVVALSVAIAWLWARTGGSLLLPMLMHAAVNNSLDIVPSASPGAMQPFALQASFVAWLTTALLWTFALGALVWMARTDPRRPGT